MAPTIYHATDPIVPRILHPTTGKLEFVAVYREECNQWAIPGGMVDPGEFAPDTLKREFVEEAAYGTPVQIITQIFQSGTQIYCGQNESDPRNTDDAWVETVVYHFHLNTELARSITFQAAPDETNKRIQWHDINLYAEIISST